MSNLRTFIAITKELKSLIKKGYSLEEISEILRINQDEIKSLIREFNLPYPKKIKTLFNIGEVKVIDNKIIRKVVKLIKDGRSLDDIADILAISRSDLGNALKAKYNKSIPEIRRGICFNKVYSKDKLIGLFKKYGSIPKVSVVTGIKVSEIRAILLNEFNAGIEGIKKILKVNKYNKCRLSEEKIKKLQVAEETYNRCGTLEAAGKKLGITRERVRQLLRDGKRYGITDYQPSRKRAKTRFEELQIVLPCSTLFNELVKNIDKKKICNKYGINGGELRKLIKNYRIESSDIIHERAKKRYAKLYGKIVENLGYHPATTEIQKTRKWRYIHAGICNHWGNFEKFRKEFNIEKRAHKFSDKFFEARKIKSIKVKNRLNEIVNFVSKHDGLSSRKIAKKLNVKQVTLSNDLSKLGRNKRIRMTFP